MKSSEARGGTWHRQRLPRWAFDATDERLKTNVGGLAKLVYNTSSICPLKSFDDLVVFISKHRPRQLVLFVHSTGGSIDIGKRSWDFKKFAEAMAKAPPVDHVNLEGCEAGRNPANMAVLAKGFRSKKISAFNFFHIPQYMNIQINSENSAIDAEFLKRLSYCRKFLMPGQSRAPKALAGHVGSYDLYYEMFANGQEAFVELPPDEAGQLSGFKARSEAKVLPPIKLDGPYPSEITDFCRVELVNG